MGRNELSAVDLLFSDRLSCRDVLMIREFEWMIPTIAESSYVDPSAIVIGDVVIGENSSVWPLTVIRGDVNIIRVGDNTNIQDGSAVDVRPKRGLCRLMALSRPSPTQRSRDG